MKLGSLGLLFIGALWIINEPQMVEYLNPTQIAESLQSLGAIGPIALILLMAIAVVMSPIPSLPIDLAAGAAYGPFLGTVYVVVGAEIGAIVSFLIGRAVGREVITRVFKVNVVFCEKCADHSLIGMVITARLLPIFSFDLVSYGAGLTNMSLKAFAFATLVGMIPPTYALVYLGSSTMTLQWPLILSGIAVVIVFVFLPKWIMQNQSAWWVRMILGKKPESELDSRSNRDPVLPTSSASTCSWCGVKEEDRSKL